MFVHCMPKYMALRFDHNKKMWELSQIYIPNCHGPFTNHVLELWKLIIKLYRLN